MSALLYILIAETLSEAIKQETGIIGFPMPGNKAEKKITQFADDTNLILRHMSSLDKAMHVIKRYELGSGSKLNYSKTNGFLMGRSLVLQQMKSIDFTKHNIQWKLPVLKKTDDYNHYYIEEGIDILGINFKNDYEQMCNCNFRKLFVKIQTKIEKLQTRNLSIKGRVMVTNTLLTSKLWYVSSILDIPNTIVKQLNTIIFQYIWKTKHNQTSRQTLYLPLDRGGLGLLDIKHQSISLRIKQINDITDLQNDTPWTFLVDTGLDST